MSLGSRMRVVGRIDLEENGPTEWQSDCDACGVWQAWSRGPQVTHTITRQHVAHCPALRLQRLLADMEAAARNFRGVTWSAAEDRFVVHTGRTAADYIDRLLARHRGAS